jgi:hypothetical protein
VLSLLLSPAENMVAATRLSNAQAPLDSERQILKRMEGPLVRIKCGSSPSFLSSERQTSKCSFVEGTPGPRIGSTGLGVVAPEHRGHRMASSGKRVNVRYSTDLSSANEVISTTHNF